VSDLQYGRHFPRSNTNGLSWRCHPWPRASAHLIHVAGSVQQRPRDPERASVYLMPSNGVIYYVAIVPERNPSEKLPPICRGQSPMGLVILREDEAGRCKPTGVRRYDLFLPSVSGAKPRA